MITNIVKQIRNIINDDIQIAFWQDGSVTFYIYETELVIHLETSKHAYVDCGLSNHKLDVTMLSEVYKILVLINENVDEILECNKRNDKIVDN